MIDDVIMPEERAGVTQNELSVLLAELETLQHEHADLRTELYRLRGRYQRLVEALYDPAELQTQVQMVDPVTQAHSLINRIGDLSRRGKVLSDHERSILRRAILEALRFMEADVGWQEKNGGAAVARGVRAASFETVTNEAVARIAERWMKENS